MNISRIQVIILALLPFSLSACNAQKKERRHEVHKIVATHPQVKDVTLTQQYVCQIRSHRHVKIRALGTGFLESVSIKDRQLVKAGDLMFKIVPILDQAKLDGEEKLAQLKLNYTKKLYEDKGGAENELLKEAKQANAQAKAQLAAAELNFATITAPFDGTVERLQHQQGSVVHEGDVLTALSDNSQMWANFDVPEARYLEYMSDQSHHKDDLKVELMLANGDKFEQIGKIGAIEADFDHETGTIPFRADFPNPDRLLRPGQTGTVLIRRVLKDAVVIPQRATFETHHQRYVFVVDKENVVHQRDIAIQNEVDDLFVVKAGIGVGDRIVLKGIPQIRDGEKVECKDADGK